MTLDKKDRFFEGIIEYQDAFFYDRNIDLEPFDDLLNEISTKVSLDKDIVRRVVSLFFSEIINSIIVGKSVRISKIGSFFIRNPLNIGAAAPSKQKIFFKYRPSKLLVKELNARI